MNNDTTETGLTDRNERNIFVTTCSECGQNIYRRPGDGAALAMLQHIEFDCMSDAASSYRARTRKANGDA